jgi:hypothetical protein
VGQDSGAIVGYLAAALEEGIAAGTFENLLLSYRDLVRTRLYRRDLYGLKVMAWGMLSRFDFVDLLPCFLGRECTLVAPRDARGASLTKHEVTHRFLGEAAGNGYVPGGWRPSIVCPAEATSTG